MRRRECVTYCFHGSVARIESEIETGCDPLIRGQWLPGLEPDHQVSTGSNRGISAVARKLTPFIPGIHALRRDSSGRPEPCCGKVNMRDRFTRGDSMNSTVKLSS